ncbi:MAG: hypothetical protein ACYTCV_10155 [Planctomycetota bacterium]|jgi:hypothetical protein
MTTEVTTQDTEQTTSQEDKFFGVSTSIDDMLPAADDDKGGEKPPEVIIEADDDKSGAEATPEKPAVEDGASDEDVEGYGKKVQKRIDKLTWQYNEERRQREAAEAVKNEAIRAAQALNQQTRNYENIINNGEANLVEQIKSRAALAVENAKSTYRKAYEEGDTEEIIKAQEAFTIAQAEQLEAMRYENDFKHRQQQQQYQQQFAQQPQFQAPPPQPQVPKPTPESETWAEKNPWFGKNEHRDMTAVAYAEHERLIRDVGVKPDTDEYYEQIDTKMRKTFPDYFKESTQKAPPTVVAPGTRNNGAKPRTVRLSPSERQVAKALGLSVEQYARQVLKEQR